jgi:hypothetical protein
MIYEMTFMKMTSLQHYKPSTIKFVLHAHINIFQINARINEIIWKSFVKYIILQFLWFSMLFFLQHIYPYNYERVWFVNVTLEQEQINEKNDAHEVGKVENWTNIKQKIVIKQILIIVV